MFEKQGKYYADWRDASGKRLRKSFTSARAALQYEAEQREQAHPKRRARGQHSPSSYAPNSSVKKASALRRTRQQKPSSLKLVHSRRKN